MEMASSSHYPKEESKREEEEEEEYPNLPSSSRLHLEPLSDIHLLDFHELWNTEESVRFTFVSPFSFTIAFSLSKEKQKRREKIDGCIGLNLF